MSLDYIGDTHLKAYGPPEQVEFIKTIPKTNIGKVIRKKLRDL